MKLWFRAALAGVLLVIGFVVAWSAVREQRRQAEIDQGLEAAMRGEYESALGLLHPALIRDRIARSGAVAFAVYACELARDGPDPRRYAQALPPKRSVADWRLALACARRMLAAHRYAPAEVFLRVAQESNDARDAVEARQSLALLLKVEGRVDEASDTFRAALSTLPDPVVAMREVFDMNHGAFPVEQIQKTLEVARRGAPGDPGVCLGYAHLALATGEATEAQRRLAIVYGPRVNCEELSRAIQRLRRRLAVQLGDRIALAELLRIADEPNVGPRERAWLWSEVARDSNDPKNERAALLARTGIPPVDFEALERLVELDSRAGRDDEARRWTDQKAALQKALEEYRDILFFDPDPQVKALPLAQRAARLGMRSEERAWLALGLRREPGNGEMRALLQAKARNEDQPPGLPTLAALAATVEGDASAQKGGHDEARSGAITFEEATAARGPHFVYDSTHNRRRLLSETTGGGLAVLDYDRDGWLDVFAVQAGPFPEGAPKGQGGRLFRNKGDGSFEDVTERAGPFGSGYGMGVTVGDIDNDGWPDLFVTRWRAYALYRNRGDGSFDDVTATWKLDGDRDWPSSAAFADIDNDGDLDLYVCHYVVLDEEHPTGTRPGRAADTRRYNNPLNFIALPDHLFRNEGDHFRDISAPVGITAADTDGRGLGVLAADFDKDGLVDFYVANDLTANFLFRNKGDGTFEDVAQSNGLSGSAEGLFQGSMGVACGDIDRDGLLDVAVTNFYGDSMTMYRGLGHGLYADQTAAFGLRAATRYMVGWGIALEDFDNDGFLDLVMTNGHLDDPQGGGPYAMPTQLFKGRGGASMVDVTTQAGAAFAEPRVGRALAAGDFDNDGRIDVMIGAHDAPVAHFRNSTAGGNRWLVLELQGTKSNRDGIGARVTVRCGANAWHAQRTGGGSYQSSGDPRLHIGLAGARKVDELQVRWPSGQVDTFHDLESDRGYRLVEGQERLTELPQYQP